MASKAPHLWIGPAGNLIPIPGFAGQLSTSRSRQQSWRTTISGVKLEQHAPRENRQWQVSLPELDPLETTNLATLFVQPAPWQLVTPDAQVGNLLTPSSASFASVSAANRSVMAVTDPGLRSVPQLMLPAAPGSSMTSIGKAPVLPGMPVTAAAWFAGTGSIGIRFLKPTGDPLGQVTWDSQGAPGRMSVTIATVPASAAWAEVWVTGGTQIAGPTLTWTSRMRPYSPGLGVSAVVPDGSWSDDLLGLNAGPYRKVSFTLDEVGPA